MRGDNITVKGFLLEYFLCEVYVHTSKYLGWKKTENLIGGKVGIRMSWVEKFQKIK